MKRMIDDYITRFYAPEDKRFNALCADNYALAREIVAWKNKVVEAWDGIKVENIDISQPSLQATGQSYKITAVIDTNGLGKDLGLEYVAYRVEDGVEHLFETKPFKVVKTEGNVLTYELDEKMREAGVYRYGFRLYPVNPNLPHRQDFAYVRWI